VAKQETSMKRSLTDATFRAARPRAGKDRDTLYDTKVPGLMLRLGRTGNTFAVKYRLRGAGRAGNQKTVTLTGVTAIDAARRAALQILDDVAHGKDPAAEIQKQRADETEATERSMAHLLKPDGPYHASLKQRHRSNIPTVMSSLTRSFKAIWTKDLRTLARQDFVRELNKLLAASKSGAWDDAKKFVTTFLAMRGSAFLVMRGSAFLVMRGNAFLVMRGNAFLVMRGSTFLVMRGSTFLVMRGNAFPRAFILHFRCTKAALLPCRNLMRVRRDHAQRRGSDTRAVGNHRRRPAKLVVRVVGGRAFRPSTRGRAAAGGANVEARFSRSGGSVPRTSSRLSGLVRDPWPAMGLDRGSSAKGC
jgi:hypothetical protein